MSEPYYCKKCGRRFWIRPKEHGVFKITWVKPATHEACDGEVVEAT